MKILVRDRSNDVKTGWPPGLLQDDSKYLSKWLSQRGNARQLVDEKVKEIENRRKNQLP